MIKIKAKKDKHPLIIFNFNQKPKKNLLFLIIVTISLIKWPF